MNDPDKEAAAVYARLVATLDGVVDHLEMLGASEMGVMHVDEAARFHAATELLRALRDDLLRDLGQSG